jgi:putative ABC transport system permease protein
MEGEMDAELQTHLEVYAEELERHGVSRQEAWRQARVEFGGFERTKEECREARGVSMLDGLKQDLRFGVRTLLKNPGFAAVAVLTLALGIGATTTVFSLVDSILLKPLPYPHPEQIVMPELISPPGVNLGSEYFPWSQGQFRFLTQDAHPFTAVGAFQSDSFNLTGRGDPYFLDGFRTSAQFFSSLGVTPALGRTYTEEGDRPGHEYEVVLSDRLWRERFSANREIVGQAVQLNGRAYTVVGVMPAGFVFPRAEEMPSSFNFPREAQLWVPLAIPTQPIPGPSELAVIARLREGIGIEQAQAVMDVVRKHAETQDPRWKGWFTTRVVPLTRQVVGDTRRPLQLMFCAVCVVLLIACSNVANLLLARSIGRQKEFTLRASLGAERFRLVRQLLTESLLIAMTAGAAGVLLAYAGISFVKIFGPVDIPRLREVTLDPMVLGFALLVSIGTGILFGLAPALGVTRQNLVDALKVDSQRSGSNLSNQRMRNALLVSEVALALVLVIAAGLLTRTFFRLLGTDGGFNAERVLTFQMSLPGEKYEQESQIVSFYRDALQRVRAIPGVQAAGIGETVPMSGDGESTVIRFSDEPRSNVKETPFANFTVVSPGYFSAVGTAILRGRDFNELDNADSMPVSIINTALAKRYWPGENPIGKHIGPGSTKYPLLTIVGVVPDVKHTSLREDAVPEMHVLYTQKPWPSMLRMWFALRTKAEPGSMTASVRQTIQSLDPDLPLAKVSTLTTLVSNTMSQPRFSMLLFGTFGAIALLLASIGMYGVISYSVMQRTREIGIRIALGAERKKVFGMVLGQGAKLTLLGIGIGLLVALGVTRWMTSFLYEVQPADPLTFAGVSVLLVGVALLACYLPARRAMKTDPIIALRHE